MRSAPLLAWTGRRGIWVGDARGKRAGAAAAGVTVGPRTPRLGLVEIVRPFAVDVARAVARAVGFRALLWIKVSPWVGINRLVAGDKRQTFFTPARLARLPAPVAGFGVGLEAGVFARRSLPKILAARSSFFLRSRAGGLLVRCLSARGGRAQLHTLVDHLFKISGDFAAVLAVGGHGGQRNRSARGDSARDLWRRVIVFSRVNKVGECVLGNL